MNYFLCQRLNRIDVNMTTSSISILLKIGITKQTWKPHIKWKTLAISQSDFINSSLAVQKLWISNKAPPKQASNTIFLLNHFQDKTGST